MTITTFFRRIGWGGVVNTLYINLKVFPLSKAIKFPVICGKKIHFKGLRRGCIECPNQFASIRLGIDGGSWEMHSGLASTLNLKKSGTLIFKGLTNICSSFVINVAGEVQFGDNFFSNTGFLLSCEKKIYIGCNALLGWNVTMLDGDGHTVLKDRIKINEPKDIIIDNHCWLAANVTILKGVHLLDSTIVPMGSVVTKSSIKSNCIYGATNKIIKENIDWKI
jgi:acetyltransferase-like isoleucine patch superfamily enzyme